MMPSVATCWLEVVQGARQMGVTGKWGTIKTIQVDEWNSEEVTPENNKQDGKYGIVEPHLEVEVK